MDNNDKQITHLFQIYKTLIEILSDRNYLVSAFEQNMDLQQFRENYGTKPSCRDAMFSLHMNKDDPTDQIFIFFVENKNTLKSGLSVKDINAYESASITIIPSTYSIHEHFYNLNSLRSYPLFFSAKVYEKMKEKKVNRSIIVFREKASPQAKQALQILKGFTIELFMESELLVNITRHRLVPKHTVLTVEQKRELLNRYKVDETQLPRIQKDDPVARYYGLKHLQVVKIIRDSETAGRYITYRIVW